MGEDERSKFDLLARVVKQEKETLLSKAAGVELIRAVLLADIGKLPPEVREARLKLERTA